MTPGELAEFKFGYDECRRVFIGDLKEILSSKKNPKKALENLIGQMEQEEATEHWEQIQKDYPGMTREEYELESEKSADVVRKKYYNENGYLKPRLVRNLR